MKYYSLYSKDAVYQEMIGKGWIPAKLSGHEIGSIGRFRILEKNIPENEKQDYMHESPIDAISSALRMEWIDAFNKNHENAVAVVSEGDK